MGAAIAVGIQMFNNQSYSANKSAIAADAQSYASQIVQYFKTPISQGGAGQPTATMDADAVGGFIGWGDDVTDNDNGDYIVVPHSATTVYVYGIGKEEKDSKKPAVRTTVTLPAGSISAQVIDAVNTTTTANVAPAGFGS
ncbi:MAG: hypothetical protein LHW48_06980 [Candidatus Cloacimonetes bacterium]|nr:hypothetical protein [Candidatus Cloacimonadota bacterium]